MEIFLDRLVSLCCVFLLAQEGMSLLECIDDEDEQ